MIDESNTLENEWQAQVLLNPFAVIDSIIDRETLYNSKDKDDAVLIACNEVIDIFMRATNYLEVRTESEIIEYEKLFLLAMFLYLQSEAPPVEQNLCMVCELLNCDRDYVDGEGSDLDRLFCMLEEKDEDHTAVDVFRQYRRAKTLRKAADSSLRRRLRPIISVCSVEDYYIFSECGRTELFELAASLVHNAAKSPQNPTKIYDIYNDTVYATVVLVYLITADDVPQTTDTLFDMFRKPKDYAPLISEALKTLSPNDFPDLQNVISHWFSHIEKKAISGEIELYHLNTLCDFFCEYK